MKTVYKYSLRSRASVELPAGAVVLHVGLDPQGQGAFWAFVDTDNDTETRRFVVTGTGHPVPDGLEFLGTYVEGPFVWHAWEQVDGQD